jgi:hypothetical protein
MRMMIRERGQIVVLAMRILIACAVVLAFACSAATYLYLDASHDAVSDRDVAYVGE